MEKNKCTMIFPKKGLHSEVSTRSHTKRNKKKPAGDLRLQYYFQHNQMKFLAENPLLRGNNFSLISPFREYLEDSVLTQFYM
jgi:hypothetical protein